MAIDDKLKTCDFCWRSEVEPMIAGESKELLQMRQIRGYDGSLYIVCVDCEKKGVDF